MYTLCNIQIIFIRFFLDNEVFLFDVFFLNIVNSIKYDNVTVEPGLRQLYDFRLKNQKRIGLMTTSSGEPVDIRDTFQINSDQFSNQYHLDIHTKFDGERIPERIVHAKGTAAYGYLDITNDVTKYTSADLFNEVGKKTDVVARFSTSPTASGGSDFGKEFKAIAFKFYTEEGNLDLLCLQAPVYLYRDTANFPHMVHSFKKNPRTGLVDPTLTWDFITLRPETIHNYLWLRSDYGSPKGYRRMDVFPIHTYELSNKNGDRHYIRFNFRTEQGLDNMTNAQIAAIQGVDLDFYNRDLYNAIERKEYPAWRMEMDVLTIVDLKKLDYDPFDVTRSWKNGTYKTIQIGRVVMNKNPDNMFRVAEQSAFNPGNLVPGIPGPVDHLFKTRRVTYPDTQNYRLGRNHNNILVNMPKYAKTYNRDGRPPVRENMRDAPNYYPNSFNGPMPYVDETRPAEKLLVLQRTAVDLKPAADFYNNVLENDAQRQRMIDTLVGELTQVTPPVQKRAIKMLYLVDTNFGKRVDIGVKAALLTARANQSE